ncbi:MBL fold metallo-hydrolase [Paenibacillus naphthalenovorans]|uniref:Metal-binding protein n=1 Tax=Paenibacillus naphthalenovorans TaxID=162209 RepID=A0A0U2WBU9_9BACL|nr:MBL fold metallo-hydrolase [Paenibacillus naphthalenovorans]ALS23854.1 metal-binding protein [Paenibacillus naphthalenovorans]
METKELVIESFSLGPLQTNAYLISLPGENKAVVIDPGMNPNPLLKRVADMEIEAILLTHAHFDHIGGVEELRRLKGCPVYLHDDEADWLVDPKKNGSARWPDVTGPITTAPAEYSLADGQNLSVLGLSFKVFHTPGHSPGSVSFLYGKHLFGGDVLFKLSVGRTDLPGGSHQELLDSIHGKLFELPDDTIVYPGHGPRTSIGYEREHNPYV